MTGRGPWFSAPCGCREKCGDDGDTEGPGTCKGLSRMPEPPLIEFYVVHRDDLRRESANSYPGADAPAE